MNPFIEKYHHLIGTHCWFCDREYGVDKHIFCGTGFLFRTREHIIPKSIIIYNYYKNYIGSCRDCNNLKGTRNAKEFAIYLEWMIKTHQAGTHNMYKLFPLMRQRSWKLYNKTSDLHVNYKSLRNK